MQVSRRTILKGALGAAGLGVAGGFVGLATRQAYALPTPSGAGTTLAQTIIRGAPGAGGYVKLTAGPAEPFLFRGDLAGVGSHSTGRRQVLACFAHLTDVHIMDVQSPARFEFLDAYGAFVSDFTSAYRPQELLSAQVGDAMIQQLRGLGRGP